MNGAYVVDAAVVVKWYLTEEEAADKAAVLLDHFYDGQVTPYAPPLITYEVPARSTGPYGSGDHS